MNRNSYGLRKIATGQITDSAAFIGTLAALGVALPSIGLGWVLGKTTAPRKTDISNLQKQYRLARLRNDKRELQIRQAQINQSLAQPQNAAKSVYGLVNS